MVNLGPRNFIGMYAAKLGGVEKTKEILDTAHRIHAGALNVYMRYGNAFNSPLPYVIPGSSALRSVTRASINQTMLDRGVSTVPTGTDTVAIQKVQAAWTALFGSLDVCACEHCVSLYGPAAYFVDILRFLDAISGKQTPLQLLLARRPDLEFIELTCDNSTTPLPYVDLANELLEAAIVPRTFKIAFGAGLNPATDLRAGRIPDRFPDLFTANSYPLGDSASVRPDMRNGVLNDGAWVIIDTGWVFFVEYQPVNVFVVSPWPQTSWSENELAANPEHVHAPAYTVLSQAVYPWDLPFDLPLEEARTYLRHLGVPGPS